LEFPQLKQMCDLICSYSTHKSYTAIASRLGLSESTLRGYWELSGGKVPDKNLGRFSALIQEISPVPLSDDAALNLLRGSPVALHNILLPIEGTTWRDLVDEQALHGPLEITTPPAHIFGFGEVDDNDVVVADAEVPLNERFRFKGRMNWSGEAFLAAEHGGEWHLIPLNGSQRSFVFSAGEFELPPSLDGKARYMREREKSGYYRYVVVAQRGTLSDDARHQIHRANPYSQLDLDLLGSTILQSGSKQRAVMAATLRVTAQGD
jgi:hypothetical protein